MGSETGRSHAYGREKGSSNQVREVVAHACALSEAGPVDIVDVEGTSEPEEAVSVP